MENCIGSDLKNKGFVVRILRNITGVNEYEVTKPKGLDWPSNEELLNYCNNGVPKFGGTVQNYYDTVCVRIYTE